VNRQALDELKQQIPLLDYLQAHDWQPVRHLSRGRLMGLCPLHEDHEPSALLNDVGTPVAIISQLNTLPAFAPVNASTAALRLATYDSGTG
jgi:hypothetical protein